MTNPSAAERIVPPIHGALATEIDAAICAHLTEEEYENIRSLIVSYVTTALVEAQREVWEAEQHIEAYRDIATCYRIGARPTEKQLVALDKASEYLRRRQSRAHDAE